MAMHYYICPSLYQNAYRESRNVPHVRKREHITPVLFQMHCPVSHIQSTELNSTIVSKGSDQKVYTNETAAIWVVFTFDGIKNPHQSTEIHLSEYQLPGYGISCQIILNLHQVKKYFVRYLKNTYLCRNWVITLFSNVAFLNRQWHDVCL